MSSMVFKSGIFALVMAKVVHYGITSKDGNLATKMINTLVVIYSTILLLVLISETSRQTVLDFISTTMGGGAGTPLPERDYGDVCAIYVPNHPSGDAFFNVSDRVDIFVIAHSVGWFIKALILRDVKTAWVCSILFEVIELCFAHLLPNFNECWWDSVIMDVFGCNMIGIHSADLVLTMTGATKFNFLDRAVLSSSRRKTSRAIFGVCLMTILISLIDLNFFFLKFVFYFPTTHWVCFFRTLLWVLISIPGAIQLFHWSTKPLYEHRSCAIGCMGLVTEIIFYTTLRGESFANATPTPLPTFLLIVTLVYATFWSGLRS